MGGVSENYCLDVLRVIQHPCLVLQCETILMLEDLLEEETKLWIINTTNVHLLDGV